MGSEIGFLFYFFLVVVAALTFRNKSKINVLFEEVKRLKAEVAVQKKEIGQLKEQQTVSPEPATDPTSVKPEVLEKRPADLPSLPVAPISPALQSGKKAKPSTSGKSSKAIFLDLERFLNGNGLLWLGALVLAFGGIFLAKYSIETGLLSAAARVSIGGIFGIALIVVAEYLERHKKRFDIHSPYVSAALASGGVITCYALILVSFNYYTFLVPTVAFTLLAIVSLTASYLALRFGPLLACIGLIGAYAVPALVPGDSDNIMILVGYLALVSASAIWVAESVKRNWLWWLSWSGHFLWFFTTVATSDNFWALVLLSLFTIYLFALLPTLGWRLQHRQISPVTSKRLIMFGKAQWGGVLPLLGMGIFLLFNPVDSHVIASNLVFACVYLLLPKRHSIFDGWPFLMLAFALFSFPFLSSIENGEQLQMAFQGSYLFIQISVIAALAYCIWMLRQFPRRSSFLLLLVLAPLLLYGCSYTLSTDAMEDTLYPLWALELALIAIGASLAGMKTKTNLPRVCYTILANGCLTLCLTMFLSASVLTLAFTAQIAAMSYISNRAQLTLPDWLYKIALTVVAVRLTIAPWLEFYTDEEILSVHWTAVVYPLVLITIAVAKRFNPSSELQPWLTGMFLHVVALLITTETTYALVGHYSNPADLSFKETIILALNWWILAVVYLWRANELTRLRLLYESFGGLLLMLGGLLHIDILLNSNPYFEPISVGEPLLLNWLLPLWAVPAVLLGTILYFQLLPVRLKRTVEAIFVILAFLYINGEIRAAFNDGFVVLLNPPGQAELYTYSIVWLCIATITLFWAQSRQLQRVINAGFCVLAAVILKAFLIDMANLEGLYRAISFIGLGLCLVALGWLFQKFRNNSDKKESEAELPL
ncbi:DUF2339 domain-containing protein [Alteromonas pelagimontana]|uniref:DUF2339 domain-containing protein n=1 Tax=Alteromonas pelagimontana TaxID=1858656 RepID=A0A6M4ME33_9ALTE|nr:DUF2339 domain-containing protein [Alteromonas pelagimontana]QJR80416.1 DUF2339 domain-containing protein [Alteromonas pelagimontana]